MPNIKRTANTSTKKHTPKKKLANINRETITVNTAENSSNNITVPKNSKPLTVQETFDVLEYASAFAKGIYGNNFYSPYLTNDAMKRLNQNAAAPSSLTELTNALTSPKSAESNLRQYSQYFENTEMVYKRMLERYGKMLAFDYTWTCKNATYEDYSTNEYKEDENRMIKFLDKMNCKQEFTRVVEKILRDDAHYVAFRTQGDKYTFQELPTDYCKITGRWQHGFLFDFNLMYFISNPGVDPNLYPPVFKKYLERVKDPDDPNKYIPSNNWDSRSGHYVYWTQTSPDDGLFCWKFDNVQAGQTPYFSPLFLDLFNSNNIRQLQNNKYIIAASRILVGLIPLLKNSDATSLKDKIALDPTTIGRFMHLFRQGVDDAITTVAAPFDDVKQFDFASPNSDVNIQEDHNSTIAKEGSISDVIYAPDKLGASAFNYATSVEEYVMTYIYPYFEDFMDYQINKRTRKFKFSLKFEGINTPKNRKERMDEVKQATEIGLFMPDKWAAAQGITPQDMKRKLEYAKANGMHDLLYIPSTIYTQSANENGDADNSTSNNNDNGGRPQNSDGDLSDNGEKSRDASSNVDKGGEV